MTEFAVLKELVLETCIFIWMFPYPVLSYLRYDFFLLITDSPFSTPHMDLQYLSA